MKSTFVGAVVSLVLAAPAGADTLIVGNKGEHTVSFVDLERGVEVARAETGRAPHEIAISPDGSKAVLVSYAEQDYVGNTLHVFDVATATRTGTIDLGAHHGPHGLKWIGNGSRVIVTTERSQDVAIVDVDSGTVVRGIKTGQAGSHMVALLPDLSRAYVANIGSGSFTAIDLKKGEKIADQWVGQQAEAITVSPDGKEVWVGSNGENKVVRFDAQSLEQIGEFAVAGVPIRVEFGPSGEHVAISLADRAEVLIVGAADQQPVATISLVAKDLLTPVTMLWKPDGSALWVAATGSQKVAEIDTSDWTIKRTFAVGEGSDGLGYSPIDSAPATE